jgi:hypothetical protein
LADVGLSPVQVQQLGQIVLKRELETRQQVEAAVHQRQVDTRRSLAKLYGSAFEREVAAGNQKARQLLPEGAARELFSTRLADGSVLGDHELICRLMIELARQ